MKLKSLLASLLAVALLCLAGIGHALTTATIVPTVLSPSCLEYRIVGICYWLFCTPYGCSVRTSTKIRHYIPDAVVSSYSNTGQNPWVEMAILGAPNPTAEAGGDGTTNEEHENNMARFKNADVIGHPGGAVFNEFVAAMGYSCTGAGTPFMPYLISTLDTIAWRYNVPEMAYPEALIPGLRDIGNTLLLNQWGSVYPRGGFLHQADDYKTGAVVAQRAGDIVTRRLQPHVYLPLLATSSAGYWPAGGLVEGNATTGKWQELTPTPSMSCNVFPMMVAGREATDGGYAWALWRPYSCCRKRGQIFLFSIDFL
ncbi:MAG: hypothetical protein BACD_02589 [Bacteroides rodentium]